MEKIRRCADALYKKMNNTDKSLYGSGKRSDEKGWFEALALAVIFEYEK